MSQLSYAPTSPALAPEVSEVSESAPGRRITGPAPVSIIALLGGLLLAHLTGYGVRPALLALAAFTIVILVPTLLHELGHMVVMCRNGLTVSHLAVGVGPRILHIQTRATRYQLGLLPIAGYARAEGMPALPPGARARIAFAGPAVNLLLALLALVAVMVIPSSSTHYSIAVGGGAAQEVAPGEVGDLFQAYTQKAEVKITTPEGEVARGQLVARDVEKRSDTEYTMVFGLSGDTALTVSAYPVEHTLSERLGFARSALLLLVPGAEAPPALGKLFGLTLLFFAVNVMLAAFNLIPLLPLDGGHITLAALDRAGKRRFLPAREQFAKYSLRVGIALILTATFLPLFF